MFIKSAVMLVTAFVACSVGYFHHHHNHPWHGHGPFGVMKVLHELQFSTLAAVQRAVDERVRRGCARHGNAATREVVEAGRYSLTTPLPGYAQTDFEIKAKNRVLYIRANNNAGAHYIEMRILPTFADASHAVYVYDGSSLTVYFPTDASGACAAPADAVVAVPAFALSGPQARFTVDKRFGDDGNATLCWTPCS